MSAAPRESRRERDAPVPLSRPLQRLIGHLSKDVPGIAHRIEDALKRRIPDYARMQERATLRDVHDSVTLHARLWYQALLAAQPPTPEDLEAAAVFARRRVHQGVTIGGLLQAFRVGSGVVWRQLLDEGRREPELHQEMLFKVSPYLIRHFDAVAQAIGGAYAGEQDQGMRWRDRLRHELCAIVLDRPDDETEFRSHVEALGADPSAPYAALALRLRDVPGPDEVDRMLGSVARCFALDRHQLVSAVHWGDLLLWIRAPHGEGVLATELRLAQRTAKLVSGLAGIASAGVGLSGVGTRGWHLSADQARRAMDLGLRIRPRETVFRYSEVVLDDAALGSNNVTHFLESLIARLAPEPELLRTLEVFFDKQQHRKAVAEALAVHPNTLTNRLDRVEALLGIRLNDIDWLAKLHAALRWRRISAQESRA